MVKNRKKSKKCRKIEKNVEKSKKCQKIEKNVEKHQKMSGDMPHTEHVYTGTAQPYCLRSPW